jgi:hypothetical protein
MNHLHCPSDQRMIENSGGSDELVFDEVLIEVVITNHDPAPDANGAQSLRHDEATNGQLRDAETLSDF